MYRFYKGLRKRPVYLVPQVLDMYIDCVGPALVVIAPGILHKAGTRHDRAGVLHKILQNGKFFAPERNHQTAALHAARAAVERQFADGQFGLNGIFGNLAQTRPYAGLQFFDAERLGDVVVGAGIEQADFGAHRTFGRQNNNWRLEALGAQLLANGQARHVGQAKIEQHDVKLFGGRLAQTAGTALGRVDVIGRIAQRFIQGQGDSGLVFYDQYASDVVHHSFIITQQLLNNH